jgi:glycosyltransferase involved in cell wall biosynthesis
MREPLFSIITICYNARDALRQTIESVNPQTYPLVEHVFVDGGSSDGSVALIQKLAQRDARWVSEPDDGIADAFNKGTKQARGDYICYLNAGDIFARADVLARVAEHIATHATDTPAVFLGDFVSVDGGVPRSHQTTADLDAFAWANPINHQSAFIPRRLALDYPYDQRLVLGMDYDFWLRIMPVARFHKLPFPVSFFAAGGRSSTPAWEVHVLLIHRVLWHINRGSRMTGKDLLVLSALAVKFKAYALVRRLLGRRCSLSLRAAKTWWLERKRRSDQANVANLPNESHYRAS